MQKKRFPTPLGSSEKIVGSDPAEILTGGARKSRGSSGQEWQGEMKILSLRDTHGLVYAAVQICSHSDSTPVPAAELFPIRVARLCHQYKTLAELRIMSDNQAGGDRYQFESVSADSESLDLVIEALRYSRQKETEAVVCCVDKKTARLYQRSLGFSVVANSRNNPSGHEIVLIMLPLVQDELNIRVKQARQLETLLKAI